MTEPRSDPSDAIDARVVKALSHPTRVRVLELLQERELASPVELANELDIPLGTVSYHIRRLEQLGFIELASETQRRGAVEHHYRARQTLDLPRRRRRRPAGTAPDAAEPARQTLDEAQHALAAGGFDAFEARADGRALQLDERGAAEVRALLHGWEGKVARIERDSARRLGKADGRAHAATALMAIFTLDA
ncbi:MAG TPA: winged helix-turn-helix domain-containing protein [Conexibacter sp.]|jgi:DNA-binding transcriptional ArsR family regulator